MIRVLLSAPLCLHIRLSSRFTCWPEMWIVPGQRLGREDHVVAWRKPSKPAWMDEQVYTELPDQLAVRELRVRVRRRGFRTQVFVVVTT